LSGQGGPGQRALLRDVDIRSKSTDAIRFCARAQINGGVTQIVVSSLMAAAFLGRSGDVWLVGWALLTILFSVVRIVASRRLIAALPCRRPAKAWGRLMIADLFVLGLLWGSLPWLPFEKSDMAAMAVIFFIPTGIAAAAASNLTALPPALLALVVPIAFSHMVASALLVGGFPGLLIGLNSLAYVAVVTVGTLMANRTLVNERRLNHANRVMKTQAERRAQRLSATLDALEAAQARLVEANRLLEVQAGTDPLTGIANRRALLQRLEQERDRVTRYGGTFSLLLIDLDHFKAVNDLHGHQTGDAVLVEAAHRISAGRRASDLTARYGGEEFAVLLPETGRDEAAAVAERIRRGFADDLIQVGFTGIPLTCSIGVSQWRGPDDRLDGLMNRADHALYRAKEGGRDQVCLDAPAGSVAG